jgi:hypothetical protein
MGGLTSLAWWKSSTMNGYGDDTFILAQQVEQVYYLSYPCQKLNAWCVVHKVNPSERLYTVGDAGCHDTLMLDDDDDEVYQEEELAPSFIVNPGAGLNDLVFETGCRNASVRGSDRP